MNNGLTRRGACVVSLGMGAATLAEVTFTHDVGAVGVPAPPGNSVFAAPDVADLFWSGAAVCSAPGANLGNAILVDNPLMLGLLPGDNIDAVHVERRALPGDGPWFPTFIFSTDVNASGVFPNAVQAQAPNNAADIFQTSGFGYNTLCVNENQMGLATRPREDIDGFFVTPLSVLSPTDRVYFSLTPGSPTLAAIGASAADVLSNTVLSGVAPIVSISAGALGLRDGDDLDGLAILAGVDANANGYFDDPGDRYPWVNFSVSATSRGLPGTAVALQAASDPPVGGDIYFSLGGSVNGLFFDDGVGGLGLTNTSNVDGLDLPEMAIPPGLPGSTPFTGGSYPPIGWVGGGGGGIPGGGGGGGGGGPGGGPITKVRISVCDSDAEGSWKVTVTGKISCNGGATKATAPNCATIPCNDAAGAAQAIAAAMQGLTVPAGCPDAGKPLFGGAGAVAGAGTNHGRVTVNVNPALSSCQVISVSIRFCPCITVDMALLNAACCDEVPGVYALSEFYGPVYGGAFMLTMKEGDEPYLIAMPNYLSEEDAAKYITSSLNDLGFTADYIGPQLRIFSDPSGAAITDVWAYGLLGSKGASELSFGYEWDWLEWCLGDIDQDGVVSMKDVAALISRYGDEVQDHRADLNRNGVVDLPDLALILAAIGPCPAVPDIP